MKLKFITAISLAILMLGAVLFYPAPFAPVVDVEAQNVPCYFQVPVAGAQKFVAASGCEIEVRSGATFDLQDGATVDFSGGVDLDGSTLTWDPAGATTAVASYNNIITYTLGAAAGRIDVLTGSLKVGNGTPDTTLNGEDAYVEGTFEVDGAVNLDGAVDIDGALTSATGAISIADTLNATGAVDFDATFNVDGASTLTATTLSDDLNVSAQTVFSVVMGIPITPTGMYMPLQSATPAGGGGTADIAAGTVNGALLLFLNINATQAITVDGTGGNVECKADVVLVGGDTLLLMWDGSDWRCLSGYDNS